MKPVLSERWKPFRDAAHNGLPKLPHVDSSNASLHINTEAFILLPGDICTSLAPPEINNAIPSVCVVVSSLLRMNETIAFRLLLLIAEEHLGRLSISHLFVVRRSCDLVLKNVSMLDESSKSFFGEKEFFHRLPILCILLSTVLP